MSAEKTWAPQVSLPGPQPGAGVGALQELAGVFCQPSLPHVQTHALPSAQADKDSGRLPVEGLCQLGLIKCEVLQIMKGLLGKRIRQKSGDSKAPEQLRNGLVGDESEEHPLNLEGSANKINPLYLKGRLSGMN